MKITIFTLALQNKDINKTIDYPLHQLCIKSWDKIIKYLKDRGYEAEIKIYTDTSPEFQKVYNECIENKNCNLKSHWADAFRIYILSENPRYMWLDWDIYVRDNFEFDFEEEYIMRSFYLIYNKDNTEYFKKVYDLYLTDNLINFQDKEVTNYLTNKNIINFELKKPFVRCIVHTNFIDNQPVGILHFINESEENSDFVQNNKDKKSQYKFIIRKGYYHQRIFSLYDEKELIDFVKNHYDLSKEQLKKLEE